MRFAHQVLRSALVLLTLSANSAAAHVQHRKLQMTGDIDDSYIVVFKDQPGAAAQGLAETLTADFPNAQITQVYDKVLSGFAAQMTAEEAAAMADSDLIDYIEQDGTVTADNVDSWGLDRSDQRDLPLDNTFSPYGNGSGVHAYILDTGIRISHEDFGGRAIWGTNTADGIDTDCDGHGTHVAGTVGGTNYGVATGTTLVAVKVLDCNGNGSYSGVIGGVNWVAGDAVGKTATANMSLGGGKSTSLNTAVNNLHNGGVPTVVAAGNSDDDACYYSPASATDVITIGSTTESDARSWFSNYGNCVDMFAPGSNIKAPWHTGDSVYNTISGTSMASPHVCGGAALLLGIGKTPAEVDTELISMATPDKVTDDMGSPNYLLFVGGSAPPPPTPPPTDPPTPEEGCGNSPYKVVFYNKDGVEKYRSCSAVEKKPQFCNKKVYETHCPTICGTCDLYGEKDSTASFMWKGQKIKCDYFMGDGTSTPKNMNRMRNWCADPGVRDTCRLKCSYFPPPCDA